LGLASVKAKIAIRYHICPAPGRAPQPRDRSRERARSRRGPARAGERRAAAGSANHGCSELSALGGNARPRQHVKACPLPKSGAIPARAGAAQN